MIRIIEHRSTLPSGGIVEAHVRSAPGSGEPVIATADITFLNERLDPYASPQSLPVAEALLQALSYAEPVRACLSYGLMTLEASFLRRSDQCVT
jgi:hypothetical protein